MDIALAGDGLDREKAQQLAKKIMEQVRDHYQRGPLGRARVLEVLNALAMVTAITVHGADDEQFAIDVFNAGFQMNLELNKENFPNPEQTN